MDGLEIVGYANVLLDSMLPSIVPPVFRLKGNPDKVFVPPYVFNAGHLCNATALSASELKALEQNQEITPFDGEPLAAQREFELWLDQARHRHYEPRAQAHATLLALAKENIQKAEQALKDGKTADAERLSGIASCADDRLVEPLAIKAALRRLMKDTTGEGLMTKLAASKMTEAVFRRLVDFYCSALASTCTACAPATQPLPDLFAVRHMFRMAERHAA
jgi:hypothetical protein